MDVWVEQEVEHCEFTDRRLKTRSASLLGELGRKIGETLPAACQDWAATKAAYRFFSNPRVDENTILVKLGGYLARGHDPPPGNMVLWRGLSRLTDIHLGFELNKRLVDN